MQTDHFFNMIEDYLEGNLTFEDKVLFEKELNNNTDLQNELNLRRNLDLFLKETAMRSSIAEVISELEDRPPDKIKSVTNRFLNYRSLLVAASIVLVGIFFSLMLILNSGNGNLYDENYTSLDLISSERGENISLDFYLSRANSEYRNKNFSLSAIYYKKVVAANPNHPEALLFAGISLMETLHFSEATKYLLELKSQNNNYSSTAKWYLALCYIKENNAPKAKEYLNELVQINSSYKSKAQTILSKLN